MEDSMIGEYWKYCECMKSVVENLIFTCNEIEDTPDSAVVNPSNEVNHWVIADMLLTINYCWRPLN